MYGRKAQVALYVLIGFVLLVAFFITFYKVSLYDTTNNNLEKSAKRVVGEEVLAPEVAAEKEQVQKRLNRCLFTVSTTAVKHLIYIEDLSADEFTNELEREVGERFSECQDMLGVIGHARSLSQPTTKVTLTSKGVMITVDQAYQIEEGSVRVSSFNTLITGPFQQLFSLSDGIKQGTIPLFDDECMIDLYAFADKGIYLDLLIPDEGPEYVDLITTIDGVEYHRLAELPQCEVKR